MRALILLSLISLLACAHRTGDVCAEGDAFCGPPDAPKTALVCKDGKLARYECLGPKGCAKDETRTILCDQSSGALVGQPCFPAYEKMGQCSGAALLQCSGGTWAQVACPSGKTCSSAGGFVACK